MMNIVDSAARPYIIKPRKRQNYRNLQPRYALIPLGLGTEENSPTTTEKTKKTWKRRWECPPRPNVSATQSNHTAPAGHSTSVLNQGAREEQAEVTKAPHPSARKVKHHGLRCETLTDETQGTCFTRTSTPLSAAASSSTPKSCLNPSSPEWLPHFNPWGNATDCTAPYLVLATPNSMQ